MSNLDASWMYILAGFVLGQFVLCVGIWLDRWRKAR
jgi:hypothetical protein